MRLWTAIVAVAAASIQLKGQETLSEPTPASLNKIAEYQGLPVSHIEIKGVPEEKQAKLLQSLPLRPGETLDRPRLQQSIQTLYASGRFADIQAEAERTADRHLNL